MAESALRIFQKRCSIKGALSLAVLLLLAAAVEACSRSGKEGYPAGDVTSRIRQNDGGEMVFVPAGEFLMGSEENDEAFFDEKPAHTVYLDAFWIDRTEVTNARFVEFLKTQGEYSKACGGYECLETKREDPDSHIFYQDSQYVVDEGYEDHPVIEVTWYGALAYCNWVGARLPTEAEWEKGARGVDGRLYPWGNSSPSCKKAQYSECSGMTAPVGSKPAGASPCGALDMAGNVWEWTADWYDEAYYGKSPARNPSGPVEGIRKTFRGGSWGYLPYYIRTTDRARNRPAYAGFNVGFRCASSVQEK